MAKQIALKPAALHIRNQVLEGSMDPGLFVNHALHQIVEKEHKVDALISLDEEGAIEQTAILKTRLKDRSEPSNLPLAGVPIILKDNISQLGKKLTCGSRMLENFVASYDATVVSKLKDAGAIVIGKSNMDEFAMGSSTENSAFKQTKNPWDLSRVPGGSSGGSAAAVASGMVPIALGSDTGGSVRQPAGFCGVVGHKPSYGRVSRFGLVAYASSLDQIGPMAASVKDAALLYDVISGPDTKDASSLVSVPRGNAMETIEKIQMERAKPLMGFRVGVVSEFMGHGVNSEVKSAVSQAVDDLEKLGVVVKEVSLPKLSDSIATYYLIATAEASSNLSRFDGIRYGLSKRENGASLLDLYQKSRGEGFGEEVKRRIILGTFALSSGYKNAYYEKALRVRQSIRENVKAAFEEVDLLVSPTAPTTAFRLGEKSRNPLAMYLEDIYTVPVNLTGIPAISINCGFDASGLPIGLQLMAPHCQDEILFAVAYAYEQTRKWSQSREPNL